MNPAFQTGFPQASQNYQQFYTAPAPSSLPRLALSPQESEYYTFLFTRADHNGTGRIEGKPAVTFFKTSNLPVDILKQVWSTTNPNSEGFLDKERFFLALKIIALAQEGKPAILQSISEKTKMPQFHGIEIPRDEPIDEWEITQPEISVYKEGFKNIAGEKGYLTGGEARELLQRTQFSMPILKKIWGLCDPLGTGIMSQEQFMVAMQIVSKVRARGLDIPDELPESLKKIIHKSSETPVQAPPQIKPRSPVQNQKNPKLSSPQPESFSFPNADQYPQMKTHKHAKPEAHKVNDYPKHSEEVSVSVDYVINDDLEKMVKEKDALYKSKKDLFVTISDMIEFDQNELDLFKQKNKQLEHKVREYEETCTKMNNEIHHAKNKFEDGLKKKDDEIKSMRMLIEQLSEENKQLKEQKNAAEIRNQYESKTQEMRFEAPKIETKAQPIKFENKIGQIKLDSKPDQSRLESKSDPFEFTSNVEQFDMKIEKSKFENKIEPPKFENKSEQPKFDFFQQPKAENKAEAQFMNKVEPSKFGFFEAPKMESKAELPKFEHPKPESKAEPPKFEFFAEPKIQNKVETDKFESSFEAKKESPIHENKSHVPKQDNGFSFPKSVPTQQIAFNAFNTDLSKQIPSQQPTLNATNSIEPQMQNQKNNVNFSMDWTSSKDSSPQLKHDESFSKNISQQGFQFPPSVSQSFSFDLPEKKVANTDAPKPIASNHFPTQPQSPDSAFNPDSKVSQSFSFNFPQKQEQKLSESFSFQAAPTYKATEQFNFSTEFKASEPNKSQLVTANNPNKDVDPFNFSPPKKEKPITIDKYSSSSSSSSSGSLEFEDEKGDFDFNLKSEDIPQPKVEFGFDFNKQAPEKILEKSTSFSFDFKPDHIKFDPQFEKSSNQGFDFQNATISSAFKTDLFKIETAAIKPRSSATELEFD